MSQRVVITAAASGIGRAIAKAFHDAGAQVHVCDVDEKAIGKLTRDFPAISGAMVDVSNEKPLSDWFSAAIGAMGGIDVLVNNAGISGPTAPVEDVALDDWRACFAVCLESHMMTCRLAVPLMKAQKSGAIINISSGAGLAGYPFRTPYAAAKWAIIGFTKSLASEVGPYNVRVNAICPGSVSGPRMDRVITAEAKAAGRPEEDV
ncbi:MAG: SDR family oxidoreductase, partial [Hyphomicrobiales bacterium]